MRNCPKCKKAFIMEVGMTCMNYRTLLCYVSRQVIMGYEHFDPTPAPRHVCSGIEAHCRGQSASLAKYGEFHPEFAEEDLKVDFPVAPFVPAPGTAPYLSGMSAIMPKLAGPGGPQSEQSSRQ